MNRYGEMSLKADSQTPIHGNRVGLRVCLVSDFSTDGGQVVTVEHLSGLRDVSEW